MDPRKFNFEDQVYHIEMIFNKLSESYQNLHELQARLSQMEIDENSQSPYQIYSDLIQRIKSKS